MAESEPQPTGAGDPTTPADPASRRRVARELIGEALPLIDDGGSGPAATYLHYAIACLDVAGTIPAPDQAPRMVAPSDPALVRAMGGSLAVIATILARSNIVAVDELARLLGIFATITAEDDPATGTIVAAWGGMMMDVRDTLQEPQHERS